MAPVLAPSAIYLQALAKAPHPIIQKFLGVHSSGQYHIRRHYQPVMLLPEVKVSRNGPERRSGKIIIAGTPFR